jgi:hypothetical protein
MSEGSRDTVNMERLKKFIGLVHGVRVKKKKKIMMMMIKEGLGK